MTVKTLSTPRLTVRPVEAEDWRCIQAVWEDVKKSEYRIYDTPKDTGDYEMRRRIARWAEATRSGGEHIFFIPCIGDISIGFISLNACPDGYEIGYGLRKEYQKQGYAAESLNAVFEFLKERGVKRLTAGTAVKNLPSVALLKRLGFEQTGTEAVSFYKDSEGKDIFFDGGIFEKRL